MSRRQEFEDGGQEHVTLWHGTKGDPESVRSHGIQIERANPHDPVIWATQRPIHKPAGWIQGSGWGMKYRTPSFDHIVEFKVPAQEVSDQLAHPHNQTARNVKIGRSIRPEEIVTIHDMEAKYGPRITQARELQRQGPPKRGKKT